MRTLSPIRSVSPGPKPKIVFNYQPSPLKERPISYTNVIKQETTITMIPLSPNFKTNSEAERKDQIRCIFCSKYATYKVIRDNRYLCSSCAIGIMGKGLDVVRIEVGETQTKFIPYKGDLENKRLEPFQPIQPKVKEFQISRPKNNRQQELDQILKNVAREQQQLNAISKNLNSYQLTTEKVKSIYHGKKLQLKQHYQKIKAAIKLSIQKDLQELDWRQHESIKCIQSKRQQVDRDILVLQQIQEDIKPNKADIIAVVLQADYQQMLKQHKEDTAKVKYNKQLTEKLIQQIDSRDPAKPKLQTLQNGKDNGFKLEDSHLYNPDTFRLIDTKQKTSNTLFSFEGYKP